MSAHKFIHNNAHNSCRLWEHRLQSVRSTQSSALTPTPHWLLHRQRSCWESFLPVECCSAVSAKAWDQAVKLLSRVSSCSVRLWLGSSCLSLSRPWSHSQRRLDWSLSLAASGHLCQLRRGTLASCQLAHRGSKIGLSSPRRWPALFGLVRTRRCVTEWHSESSSHLFFPRWCQECCYRCR